MENVIQTEFLFSKLSEEKKTGDLLTLPKDFYVRAQESIEEMRKKTTQSEVQNAITTLNSIKTKRMQKILIYIAYKKPIPQPIPVSEEELYYRILKATEEETGVQKTTKIKILIKIPEIITTKGKKIGPYNEGEVVRLEDPSDAEFVISNKIGEIIE